MTAFLTENTWVLQLALVLGGMLVGVLTERIVVAALHGFAKRTESKWDDLLVEAIHGLPLIWFTTAGVWLAALQGGLSPIVRERLGQAVDIVVFGTITLVVIRLVSGGIDRFAARREEGLPSPTLVTNLSTLIIGIFGLVMLLGQLGIQITPLITAMGIGGLAVALALQDTLSNLFAGVSIVFSGQVRRQDYIQLSSGEEGIVTDVKARNTTIRTFPHRNLVVVPNGVLAWSIVTNYSLPQRNLWIAVSVGVSYDSDLEDVERIAVEVGAQALEAVEGAAPSVAPMVRYQEFGDSSINFQVLLSASQFTDQFVIRHEFIKRLHRRFNTEGIEIPFPIRTLHISAPEATLGE